jgi:hypothetical protein
MGKVFNKQCLGKADSYMQNSEIGPLSYATYKSQVKVAKDSHVKTQN